MNHSTNASRRSRAQVTNNPVTPRSPHHSCTPKQMNYCTRRNLAALPTRRSVQQRHMHVDNTWFLLAVANLSILTLIAFFCVSRYLLFSRVFLLILSSFVNFPVSCFHGLCAKRRQHPLHETDDCQPRAVNALIP